MNIVVCVCDVEGEPQGFRGQRAADRLEVSDESVQNGEMGHNARAAILFKLVGLRTSTLSTFQKISEWKKKLIKLQKKRRTHLDPLTNQIYRIPSQSAGSLVHQQATSQKKSFF